MAIDRRSFLKVAAALSLLGPTRSIAATGEQRFLSCRNGSGGQHLATLFNSAGDILMDVVLPARGHGIAVAPSATHAVIFARRPGDFMVVIDLEQQRVLHRLRAVEGRHFYGHGVYSPNGGLLYATENAYDSGNGKIGIYAADDDYRRVGEIDSHGIGPHELVLMPDGTTLAIANGGIRTHPDMPRAKLNLGDMRASLTLVDRLDGRKLDEYPTPKTWHQLSIRHLDVAADNRIALALQYEGSKQDRPPLVGLFDGRSAISWLTAPVDIQNRMRNYCGSVAFANDGQTFAVTSPRGGLITHWHRNGDFIAADKQADVCGVAADARRFWFSDGLGNLRHAGDGDTPENRHFAKSQWDNHLTVF